MSIYFCDSNCDLRYNKVKQLGIEAIKVPYYISDKLHTYNMDNRYNFDKFYSNFSAVKEYIMTEDDYIDAFKECMEAGEDVIYAYSILLPIEAINLNSAIKKLNKQYPNHITLVPTLSFSVGSGNIVYESALLHKKGEKDQVVVDYIKENSKNFGLYVLIDKAASLKLPSVKRDENLLGAMLNIKPIISVNALGEFVAINKVAGAKKGLSTLADYVVNMGEDVLDYNILISHANNLDAAQQLEQMLYNKLGQEAQIHIVNMSCNVAHYFGQKAVAISFRTKKREE